MYQPPSYISRIAVCPEIVANANKKSASFGIVSESMSMPSCTTLVGVVRYSFWYDFAAIAFMLSCPWQAWMINILGFPLSDGQLIAVNILDMFFMGIFLLSELYMIPLSPWLKIITTKAQKGSWFFSLRASMFCIISVSGISLYLNTLNPSLQLKRFSRSSASFWLPSLVVRKSGVKFMLLKMTQ